MDSGDLVTLIEVLDDKIDDLEETVKPLLSRALAENTSRLPLLDKAQLYVLVTYAIESILFSYLRLNGVNAKEHPIFRELTRVKQYFEKIKGIETAGSRDKPASQLDKAAAGRFIKHALSGNEKHDEMVAKLEERKAELRSRLTSQAANGTADGIHAVQSRERKLIAHRKSEDMAQKREREAGSNAVSATKDDTSTDSSISESETYQIPVSEGQEPGDEAVDIVSGEVADPDGKPKPKRQRKHRPSKQP